MTGEQLGQVQCWLNDSLAKAEAWAEEWMMKNFAAEVKEMLGNKA